MGMNETQDIVTQARLHNLIIKVGELLRSLEAIEAMETEHANATVRRMARTASKAWDNYYS